VGVVIARQPARDVANPSRTLAEGTRCNPLRQEIGLGDARTILSLRIEWPGSGTVQTFEDLEPDRFYRLRETQPVAERIPLRTFSLPLPPTPIHRPNP